MLNNSLQIIVFQLWDIVCWHLLRKSIFSEVYCGYPYLAWPSNDVWATWRHQSANAMFVLHDGLSPFVIVKHKHTDCTRMLKAYHLNDTDVIAFVLKTIHFYYVSLATSFQFKKLKKTFHISSHGLLNLKRKGNKGNI